MTGHTVTVTALAKRHGWRHGAELGIDRGYLTRTLLDALPALRLIGVDNFSLHPKGRPAVEALATTYAGRFQLLAMSTHDAAALVPDASLDFVFIDADHSDEAVTDDIDMWRPKVRPGGWLGGDDYNPANFPGVVSAVDRIFPKADVLPGRVWGVWC